MVENAILIFYLKCNDRITADGTTTYRSNTQTESLLSGHPDNNYYDVEDIINRLLYIMSKFRLPENMVSTSVLSGREFGWSVSVFLKVISQAVPNNVACLGGQFQWLLPDGTCEAYWLNADSESRMAGEPWQAYVARSNAEVSQNFRALLAATDFNTEAKRFDFLSEKIAAGVDVNNYLIFVAYFVGENA